MTLPTYCPSCRTIRQPNGTFCHMCGYSFLTKDDATHDARVGPPALGNPGLSVGDGFRFGIGFMVAVTLFSIVTSILWLYVLAGLFSRLFR